MSRHLSCLAPVSCVVLLTGVGCTFVHRPYLESYPPLPAASVDVCERVAGTYQNRVAEDGAFTLASLLFEPAGVRHDEVTLSFPRQGELKATGVETGGVERSRSWTVQEGQFSCEADRVILRLQSRWNTALIAWGRWSDEVHLYPLDDHLVVEYRSTKLMFWLIIPSYWTDSQWYRFPRVQTDDLD